MSTKETIRGIRAEIEKYEKRRVELEELTKELTSVRAKIIALKNAVAILDAGETANEKTAPAEPIELLLTHTAIACQVLEEVNKPLRPKELFKRAVAIAGPNLSQGGFLAAVYRNAKRGKLFMRHPPGRIGLLEWKERK